MGPTQTGAPGVNSKTEEIDPRCIVKFRPADDWKGEYGFDWFREGDYKEGGKTYHYKNDNKPVGVVGKYGAKIAFHSSGDKEKGFINKEGFKTVIWSDKKVGLNDLKIGKLYGIDPDLGEKTLKERGWTLEFKKDQKNNSGETINADTFAKNIILPSISKNYKKILLKTFIMYHSLACAVNRKS